MTTNAVTGPTFETTADPVQGSAGAQPDSSDQYAMAGKVISFYHLPSERAVYFKAFITNFNETFSSDWAQESVYGRADPIYMFKQTKRNVNLAFKIPAASTTEAYENLARVQALAQFLYPTYDAPPEAQTITQSPLVRLKIMNLLSKNNPDQQAINLGTYPGQTGGLEAANGVLGVIESIAIDHSLAATDGIVEVATGVILSKVIEINLNFSVIHEHPLGWTASKQFSTPSFPYGAATQAAVATAGSPQNASSLPTAAGSNAGATAVHSTGLPAEESTGADASGPTL